MEKIYLERISARDKIEMAGLVPHLIRSHFELQISNLA